MDINKHAGFYVLSTQQLNCNIFLRKQTLCHHKDKAIYKPNKVMVKTFMSLQRACNFVQFSPDWEL